MYSEEQFEELEDEELSITNETIVTMLALLRSLHKSIETDIREFYQNYGKDGVVTRSQAIKKISDKDKRKRMFVLLLTLNSKFEFTWGVLDQEFKKLVTEIIKLEKEFFGVDLDFEDLDLEWGEDWLTYADRLEDDVYLWCNRVKNDVRLATLTRSTLDELLKDLDKRFNTMKSVLESLVLTESSAIDSIARKECFKEIGVKKYQYFAQRDERTCEKCGRLHGKIFPMSEYQQGVTASPLHPRCRCWEVPIT